MRPYSSSTHVMSENALVYPWATESVVNNYFLSDIKIKNKIILLFLFCFVFQLEIKKRTRLTWLMKAFRLAQINWCVILDRLYLRHFILNNHMCSAIFYRKILESYFQSLGKPILCSVDQPKQGTVSLGEYHTIGLK